VRNRIAAWINLAFASIVVIGGLFLLGTIQIFHSPPDEDPASGWVHGLHGLLALFVLVYAAVIVHHDMRELGLEKKRVPV
jgi:hypothetical protein